MIHSVLPIKELVHLSIKEIRDLLLSKKISSAELTKCFLEQISKTKDSNTFITVLGEDAKNKAIEIDTKIASGKQLGSLAGVPITVKDIFTTENTKTTCGSKILHNYIPPYDATLIKKLKDADAIILGKTNMDEFAMGSSNENSYFGTVSNPWDKTKVPGGSSGGSAASIPYGQAIASIGTDTGGSIRQPASFCGVTGIKPTYGRVSRYGMVAFASSLDQAGTLALSAENCAHVLEAISGKDPMDTSSLNHSVPSYSTKLESKNFSDFTVGIPTDLLRDGVSDDVQKYVEDAIKFLEQKGVKITKITLPHAKYAIAAYYIVATAEASANLARFDGIKYGHRTENYSNLEELYKNSRGEGFGKEVKLRIMLGTYGLSSGYYDAYYKKASDVRLLLRQDFEDAFSKCDMVLTPTSPSTAFKLGERTKDPLQMYLSDIFTTSVNLAELPGISVPCGFNDEGLPIGLQLIGRHCDELSILQVAHLYQKETDWHKRFPNVFN